jgi:hypothetical protein
MGEACGTYGREKSSKQVFGGENLRERDNLEDPDRDGCIILEWISKK